MAIVSEHVDYRCGDLPMAGRVYRDAAWRAPRPGVLLFPEGFGISAHTFAAAERVVGMGYTAMACDLWGEGWFSGGPCPEVQAKHAALLARPMGMLELGLAALACLRGRPEADPAHIAASGFCIGATIAMELAFDAAPIVAVAGFHPSFRGLSLSKAGNLACPMHLFMGSEDYASPAHERAELEAALAGKGKDWRMTIYGGVKHSYMNPDCPGMGDRVAYDAAADAHSWAALDILLGDVFGEAAGSGDRG